MKRLETHRLILREFKLEDAEKVYNSWATDPKCTKYVNFEVHQDINDTVEVLKRWINECQNGGYRWLVELKDTNEVIGTIEVDKINSKHNNCEVGYAYASKYWGCGYATEALKRVLEYLLSEVGFYLVEANHYASNIPSGKVMEKAGMKKDGILRKRRKTRYC